MKYLILVLVTFFMVSCCFAQMDMDMSGLDSAMDQLDDINDDFGEDEIDLGNLNENLIPAEAQEALNSANDALKVGLQAGEQGMKIGQEALKNADQMLKNIDPMISNILNNTNQYTGEILNAVSDLEDAGNLDNNEGYQRIMDEVQHIERLSQMMSNTTDTAEIMKLATEMQSHANNAMKDSLKIGSEATKVTNMVDKILKSTGKYLEK